MLRLGVHNSFYLIFKEEAHVETVLEFVKKEKDNIFISFFSYSLAKEGGEVFDRDLDVTTLHVRPENTPHIAPIKGIGIQTFVLLQKVSEEFKFFLPHKHFAVAAIVGVD